MTSKRSLVLLLAMTLSLLVGCAKKTSTLGGPTQTSGSSNANNSSSSPNSLTIQTYKPSQYGNITSIPVFIKNTGENNTAIDSNSFTLKIGKASYQFYSPDSGASDFHYSLQSSNQFNSIVTFKTGSLSKAKLSKANVYYKTANGKDYKAEIVSANTNWSELSQNSIVSSKTNLGDYYQKAKQYLSDKDNTQKPADLKENFDDQNYNQLTGTIVANSKESSNTVAIILNNGTNTDMNLNLQSIELETNNHTDILVSPVWQNFNLILPANKKSVAVIPLEQKVKIDDEPFKVKLKAGNNDDTGSSNNNYFNSTEGFHPLSLVFSSTPKNGDLFTLTPDQIGDLSNIKTSYIFNDNGVTFNCDNQSDFTVSAMVTSFYLESGKDKLYATTKNNTAFDQEIAPNTKQSVQLEFKNVSTFLKAHHKVSLKYIDTVLSKH
ncbi:hypothetical protein [Lactiplantibacillus plantarum]|uniref:hypothetical protein n=1 Tax=Lactiplantibacillus plantarum TaxID=1590 RepID=UPI001BADAA11|nr:hypothetical protein [Lactiplantibacillus plantarum]MBS0954963.1 hypothetical protein [Lactiplantibacillus plantarum]